MMLTVEFSDYRASMLNSGYEYSQILSGHPSSKSICVHRLELGNVSITT